LKFALLAFSSLFSVINPISAAPIFVSLTAGRSDAARRRSAVKACVAAAIALIVFEAAGGLIFSFFGITVPAFQIAGGMLFAIFSIKTLTDGRERTPEEGGADPSVVPIGIPTIAGPGAISAVMVLVGQTTSHVGRLWLAGAILLNIVLTLLILLGAPTIVARIGETGQRIVSKIMGLITAVIGVQFILNGMTTVAVEILKSTR
jgi:MarC family membrane protein